MERYSADNLIKKKSGVVVISASNVAFTVLCAYLASICLCYISWVPGSLPSLLLYGFAAMAAINILVSGKLTAGMHSVWYCVFVIICVISTLYAKYQVTASDKVEAMAKVLIFSVAFINTVDSVKRVRIAMTVMSVSSVMLFFHLLITDQLAVDERLGTTLTGNANTFATMFMLGALCSIYLIFFSEKRWHKVLAVIAVVLQLYALALSGSRKFFLLPVILLGLMTAISTDTKKGLVWLRNFLFGVVLLFVAWWAVFNVEILYNSIGYRMEGMLAAFTGKGEVDASTEVRQKMIQKAVELWKNAPMMGHGIDNYKRISGYGVYAHNNYVELLADLGLLGMAAYYSFYAVMEWKILKNRNMGRYRWYWAILLGCLLAFDYGAVSYDLFPVQILLLLANISLQLQGKEKKPEAQEACTNE